MSLNDMSHRIHETAIAHGFTDATPLEDIALIHSELSEALEDIRSGRPIHVMEYDDEAKGKPIGVPSEMADVIIRVLHFCSKHHIDIDKAVAEKMDYNDKRPYKHGKTI